MKEKIDRGGGRIGNTNALKWTPDKAQQKINDIYEFVRGDDKCRSLAKACAECGVYEDVVYYFERTFTDEEVDLRPIKEALTIIKYRLMEQALDGDAHATMAIFILKNNHGMADKVEQKNEVTVKEFSIKDTLKFVR